MKPLVFAAVVLASILFSFEATATTYYVNGTTGNDIYDGRAAVWDGTHGPKKSIQAGVNAATSGDNVQVAKGIYKGNDNHNIIFNGKNINLYSENGAVETIMDGEGYGRAFEYNEVPGGVLDGFTLRGYATPGSTGGAIWCGASNITIRNCIITDSWASKGAGIYLLVSNAVIYNCTIFNNHQIEDGNLLNQGGSGIYVSSGSPRIEKCVISENDAELEGGGIYCLNSGHTIVDCTITGNSALKGAGIYSKSNSSGSIFRSKIMNNSASTEGGGIYLSNATAPVNPILNSVIAGNTAQRGAGIFVKNIAGATDNINNCTIYGNTASGQGGGLYSDSLGTVNINRCILWNDNPNEIFKNQGTLTASYCDVKGGYAGTENRNLDPMLGDDWRLTTGSPCIDWCIEGPLYDFEGEARPCDMPGVGYDSPSTRIYDIGADEYVDADNDGMIDWWERENGLDPAVNDAALDADSDDLNNIGEYHHNTDPQNPDTDGDSRMDGLEIVEGTNPLYPDNAEKTYYVNATMGDNSFDGLATIYDGTHGPKKTIQAGIDAAITGWNYKVLVADGTYTGFGNEDISLDAKEITVCSANGPSKTIIDCADTGRAFRINSGETLNCLVDGFGILNGNATDYKASNIFQIVAPINAGWPDWSNDNRIICELYYSGSKLRITDPDGNLLSEILASDYSLSIMGMPKWSQDCTMIVGHCTGWPYLWAPFTINGDGTNFRTYHPYEGTEIDPWGSLIPVLSPDNLKILAGSWRTSLRLLDRNTVTYDWITSPHAGGGDFSKDGTYIVAQTDGGFVWIDPATGAQGKKISAPDGRYPAISPDGKLIAFERLGKVCVIRSDGTGFAELVDGGTPRWSPDGSRIVFAIGGAVYRLDLQIVSKGGAISITNNSNPTFRNCIIKNCSAANGGAVYCESSNPIFENCLFIESTAENGGGIFLKNCNPTFLNCTVADNTATNGSGLFCESSSPTITDCIFCDTGGDEIYVVSGTPVVTYSCIKGGYTGIGNTSLDPLFVSGVSGDYYLSQIAAGQPVTSPCVDTGSATAASRGLDTKTTRNDAVPDASTVDMGYHYEPRLWIYSIQVSGTDIVLSWKASPGNSYKVLWSDDMANWNEILVGETGTWTDVGGALVYSRFYKAIGQ